MKQAYWIITKDFDVALVNGEIPFGCADEVQLSGRNFLTIGELNGFPVHLVQADARDEMRTFAFLRTLIAKPEANLLHRAVSLSQFLQSHRFCGRCAGPLHLAESEIALACEACGHRIYPTISPSIIVAVRKGRQILLANHQRHKGGIYTTLAGFVEAGEPIEQTVQREVWEESRLKIRNIRYFGSQPWSFPHSLMLGFLADYDSGEIKLQESELCDARWFDCDEPLPELPPKGTIALALIEATLALCRTESPL